MNKYIKKGLVFVIVLILYYAFPSYVLFQSGELLSLESICDKSDEDSCLVGLAYSDVNQIYKLQMTQKRKPDVLALGSSRIMQFSSDWIRDGGSFYNAGGGIVEPVDIINFLDRLPKKPKLLVINLDQFFFNKNSSSRLNAIYDSPRESGVIFRRNSKAVYIDYIKSKYTLSDINNGNIGLNACANSNGFSKDGTYFYGEILKNPKGNKDFRFEDCLSRIKVGNRRFEYGSDVDITTVDAITRIIAYCKNYNIKLIAFIPPFAPTVQHEIEKYGYKYSYMEKISPAISPLFDSKNCWLYDFQYIDRLDFDDAAFIDGFHGSKRTYLMMWIKIMESNSIARDFSKSAVELNELLESKSYTFCLH